jgi:DNA-binding NtrC family response regulator
MVALKRCDWPGNVRVLRNVLERALILSQGKIDPPSLELRSSKVSVFEEDKKASLTISFPSNRPLSEMTKDLKRLLVTEALQVPEGGCQGAAKLLGISRNSLKRYMKILRYGLEE